MAQKSRRFTDVSPVDSQRLRKVRGRGNRSTELAVRFRLVRAGISGWTLHPKALAGVPDFYFSADRIALFVDGCFWHGCRRCRQVHHMKNISYWKSKIAGNLKRDKRNNRMLRSLGYGVLRIWEHEVRSERWMAKLRKLLNQR